mmetsp:Transcript_26421/g.33844  ORF Transcript_26421/g.33844 Transcript_26421/m.33844 type:complete len:93 (+) Transcript_26421:402-680(+)
MSSAGDQPAKLLSEMNSLRLPEVLSLVSEYQGRSELYMALTSSIMRLMSTINREQQIEYYTAKLFDEHKAELAEIRGIRIEAEDHDSLFNFK